MVGIDAKQPLHAAQRGGPRGIAGETEVRQRDAVEQIGVNDLEIGMIFADRIKRRGEGSCIDAHHEPPTLARWM